jgi:hypothetical protein
MASESVKSHRARSYAAVAPAAAGCRSGRGGTARARSASSPCGRVGSSTNSFTHETEASAIPMQHLAASLGFKVRGVDCNIEKMGAWVRWRRRYWRRAADRRNALQAPPSLKRTSHKIATGNDMQPLPAASSLDCALRGHCCGLLVTFRPSRASTGCQQAPAEDSRSHRSALRSNPHRALRRRAAPAPGSAAAEPRVL